MKKIILLICAFFIQNAISFSAQQYSHVQSLPSGVEILFKNPDVGFVKTASYTLPRIRNSEYTDYVKPDSLVLETVSYIIAIPTGSEPKVSAQYLRFKKLEGASTGDTFKNIVPTVRIAKLGIKRGIYLAHVQLQPYAFENGVLKIADSVKISVDFGVKIPSESNRKVATHEETFFKNIVNSAHIPALLHANNFKHGENILKAEKSWYDPGKDYVRLATTRDGVAHVSMRDVLTEVPAFKGKTLNNFHLIFKGQKYPIAFINDNNSIADEADEFIFLGRRAAGDTTWFDTYTNESVFYLTYDEATEGEFLKPMPVITSGAEISKVKVQYHFEKDTEYHWGDDRGNHAIGIHNTNPVQGEGFYWKVFYKTGQEFRTEIPIFPTDEPITVRLYGHALSNHSSFNPDVNLALLINDQTIDSVGLNGEQDFVLSGVVPPRFLKNGNNSITFQSRQIQDPSGNVVDTVNGSAVDYITIEGQAKPHVMNGSAHFSISTAQNSLINVEGFKSDRVFVIDPVLKEYQITTALGNSGNFTAKLGLEVNKNYNIIANDNSAIEFIRAQRQNRTRLKESTDQADVIIITHGSFKTEAERLGDYRSRTRNLKVTVIDVEDIFKEFGFGRHSPFAVKDFLLYAYQNWSKPAPSYVIMFGDASWDPRKVTSDAVETDFVPVFGKPVSDYWYTLLDGDDYLSEIHIGRIPVSSLAEGKNVVDKIIEYDTLAPQPWMKRFLALAGGY
ncbi:MAG TPA: C25 family cysteine peptidase, partial [Patescibacteria group bacterium]|nr:C25 family cysteine peptidase [Patescibacteria group bacterium]